MVCCTSSWNLRPKSRRKSRQKSAVALHTGNRLRYNLYDIRWAFFPSTSFEILGKALSLHCCLAWVFFDLNYFMKIRRTNFNFKLFFFQYDDESAVWAYTFGKSVYDYACMYMVMMEIKSRLPPNKFQPRTILDFGSGVGTSIW